MEDGSEKLRWLSGGRLLRATQVDINCFLFHYVRTLMAISRSLQGFALYFLPFFIFIYIFFFFWFNEYRTSAPLHLKNGNACSLIQ